MQFTHSIEQMLLSTTRLELTYQDGSEGTGTAFAMMYQRDAEQYSFLVSNRHVVANAMRGRMTFTRMIDGTPSIGASHTVGGNDFSTRWFFHPDEGVDVAIMPLIPVIEEVRRSGTDLAVVHVGFSPTKSAALRSSLTALEEVVFIGYPAPIWDDVNLLPVIRRGTTASHIAVNFKGKRQFLIDASVFPGSSGSPVFWYDRAITIDATGNAIMAERSLFLGIISEVYQCIEYNQVVTVPVPTVNVPIAIGYQMIDLGIVIKSEVIVETIELLLETTTGKTA
jgi:hypothetical protein